MIEKNWKEIIKPSKLEVRNEKNPEYTSSIIAEPLERGYGVTIGNALRRILLSSLQGSAITSIQVQGVLHEFSSIPGVREDLTDIILNVKGIKVRMDFDGIKKIQLNVDGPSTVTAGMIVCPPEVEIMNKDHEICTLDQGAKLNVEFSVENGKGYVSSAINRKEDIPILFRKFASDFAQKYNMPTLRLDEIAQDLLCQQDWKGNIRQLRNIAEQMSILEKERSLNVDILNNYLPNKISKLPATLDEVKKDSSSFSSEREILYKVLFDMKNDLNDLKKLTMELMKGDESTDIKEKNQGLINKLYGESEEPQNSKNLDLQPDIKIDKNPDNSSFDYAETIEEEETLSLHEKEVEMIKQALIRTNGKRKYAAKELGISERTLYRKIKQHNLGDVSDL